MQLPDGTIEFHEVKPGYRQKLKDGTRREAPFCFEDAKLKIRIAAAQLDEFGFLIVFPLKAGGWGRVEFGSHPIALSKATCAPQEAYGAAALPSSESLWIRTSRSRFVAAWFEPAYDVWPGA